MTGEPGNPLDVLELLARDARRLRMARPLPADDQPLTPEHRRRVAEDLARVMKVDDLSLADVARGIGVSTPTLSEWRKHAEQGDANRRTSDDTLRKVHRWMEAQARRAETPRNVDWVRTDVAVRMMGVIHQIVAQSAMGVITADAGRGKTMTMEVANGLYPGSVALTASPVTASMAGFAHLLRHELKLGQARGGRGASKAPARDTYFQAIDELEGTRRVLFIDQAHDLRRDALEFVSALHNKTGCPVVFFGTRGLRENIDDPQRDWGQLVSRCAMHFDANEYAETAGDDGEPRPLHTVEEIRKLFSSGQLKLADDGAAALARIANTPSRGGLRLARQVFHMAHAAAIADNLDLTGEVIMAVLRQMHGELKSLHGIEREMADQPDPYQKAVA